MVFIGKKGYKGEALDYIDSGIIYGGAMPLTEDNTKPAFRESRMRSLMKALVYRILSITGTGILTWAVTEDIREAASITLIIQVFLIILYYSSERIWDRINWGRIIDTI